MGCTIILTGWFFPRFLLFCIWAFTTWEDYAFRTAMWPLLGFVFMPCTTLMYMAAMLNNNFIITGIWSVFVLIAIVFDVFAIMKVIAES